MIWPTKSRSNAMAWMVVGMPRRLGRHPRGTKDRNKRVVYSMKRWTDRGTWKSSSLKATERFPMGLRPALFVIAAVIFAPYSSGDRPSEPPRGADLAARVLAPTVDEGAIRGTTPEVNHQVASRHVTKPNPAASLVIRALLAGVGLAVLWLVASHRLRVPQRSRHSPRLSRAPPLFQLA